MSKSNMTLSKYEEDLLQQIRQIPQEYLPNVVKLVEIFKDSLLKQREELEELLLLKEFASWDKLSDEALANFEESLK